MEEYPSSPTDYLGGDEFGVNLDTRASVIGALHSAPTHPRVFVMGPRSCGKTSVQRVVFRKMSPHETLFLEPTTEPRIHNVENTDLVKFQLVDFPGSFSFLDPASNLGLDAGTCFRYCHTLLFVLDAQDDPYTEALQYIVDTARLAAEQNPSLNFEVFINKVDGDSYLTDDHKIDVQRDIHQQIEEELLGDARQLHFTFYLTSIYDHTIFASFSKIVQKLLPQLPFLENLLDSLIASCGMEKAFLFDVVSKVYIATDSNPVDVQISELCSDMIDVVVDISCIYGSRPKGDPQIDALAFDADSACTMRLSIGYVLQLRYVHRHLALICLLRDQSFAKSGIVEHDIRVLCGSIGELLTLRDASRAQQLRSPQDTS